MSYFGRLAPYFERPCLRLFDTASIQGAPHDVVANTRQVFHTPTTHQDTECS